MKEIDSEIFRDELKEFRSSHYVTYQPADSRRNFAMVDLVFYDQQPSEEQARHLMEDELKFWLVRFPVPIMVTSFDSSESLLHLAEAHGGSHLMGYIEAGTGNVVKRWGVIDEMPPSQMTPEHFTNVYHDVRFRSRKDVVEAANCDDRKLRAGLRVIRTVIVFVAAVPLAIELVSLGVTWLGYLLQGVSICTGIYKIGKALGWIKESKSSREEEAKKIKMRHYYYHCERNPEAFNRLNRVLSDESGSC